MIQDKFYMQRALTLAAKAKGRTSPNPMVGAIIVKAGEVIAEGWHERAGQPHAEVVALSIAGENAKDADMYVTLEPCSHQGRTGPCTDAIIKAGIKRIFVAMRDPNPLVSGKGVGKLKNAGINVQEGILEEQAANLNEIFLKWITKKVPFVACKYAMTLDGKIAAQTGDSKWITGEKARERVHLLRDTYDTILIGIGTVLADNPELTCRLPNGRNPVRVILDSRARMPCQSKLLHDEQARTIVATTELAPKESVKRIKSSRAEIIQTKSVNGRVDLHNLLIYLAQNELTSVLVEGGGQVHGAFFKENLVDKVYAFIAPKIIGGKEALAPVGGIGVDKVADAVLLKNINIEQIGEDFLLTGYVKGGGN